MSDLLQSQIKESCKLALPEGLKDLMSDISREVLRAQPQNLYQFIADYLSALLVARENLTIAAQLCKDVCAGSCYPELDDELRFIGLREADAEIAKKLIVDYFESDGANETNLLVNISKKIRLKEDQLPAIQQAVRRAFQRNLINNTTLYETSSDSDLDDVTRAAKHTLNLYRKTQHTPAEYEKTAAKVETAYRAYGVRRYKCSRQEALPLPEKMTEKNLRFSFDPNSHHVKPPDPMKPCFLPTVSSTSLCGSYMNLPKYVPYSVHDKEFLGHLEETPEKEHLTIDYSDDETSCSGHKKISFQDVPQAFPIEDREDQAMMADDEGEEPVETMYESEFDDEGESGGDREST
ncbi:hypothetical protein ABMA28_005923 [Loxostege sticticalis]|uniref:RIIa domain-containing protein n=1 Tax=Loxostege sticticalis TaxID=481309 RepID=A0ABD0SQL9_LOXSC